MATAVTISPTPILAFLNNQGQPCVGGSVLTQVGGVNTATYQDSAGTIPLPNPIPLNNRGEISNAAGVSCQLFIQIGFTYVFTLFDAYGNQLNQANYVAVSNALSSTTSATAGAGLVGFAGQLNYAIGTIGWATQLQGILPEWFGAVGDGVTDDTAAVQAAATAAATLTGPQYTDTMGQAPYGYGTSRRLKLSGKKYAISNTITLAGNVGIYAEGGGFLAVGAFPAAAYMVDTGSNPNCGNVRDITLDGAGKNVKGFNAQNMFNAKWSGITVANCANDSFTYSGGSDFTLTGFHLSTCATPTSTAVAGLRVLGSDATFVSGSIEYAPQGAVINGGGNNEFVNVHVWGTYTGFKTYISFTLINASRNSFTNCYADSPCKQDFTQGNLVIVAGQVNGGIGFYVDANSAQNTFTGCRGYVNLTKWAAYLTANPSVTAAQFYDFYIAGQYNTILGLTHNYVGSYWLGDLLFASNAVRDNTLAVGTPNTTNGIRAAILSSVSDAGGSVQNFTVENTNNSFATSEARVSWRLGGGDITYAGSVFGPAGAAYWYLNHIGAERLRIISNGSFQPGSDNTQNFGNGSLRWATFFAGTGTINTSDQREKQDIRALNAAEKSVGVALKSAVKAYRWQAAVVAKADSARIHVGWIAQEVMAAFAAQGLDPFAYGVCCHDTWSAEPAVVNTDGTVARAAMLAGDRYGVRHDELVAFILGAL